MRIDRRSSRHAQSVTLVMLIMVKTAAVITRSVLGEIPRNVNIVLMMLWNRLLLNGRLLDIARQIALRGGGKGVDKLVQ